MIPLVTKAEQDSSEHFSELLYVKNDSNGKPVEVRRISGGDLLVKVNGKQYRIEVAVLVDEVLKVVT